MRKVLGSVAMVLGVLLLVLGVLAKPVLYKGLATVKLDQRSESTSQGSGMSALYAHEVNGSAVFDKLQNVNLKSTREVIGIPGRVKAKGTQDDQAFWQTTVQSQAQINGKWTDLSYSNEGVSFNRKSGTATNCCGDYKSAGDLDDPSKLVPVDHQGNFFKFPFDVQKKSYSWWDGDLGKATDMQFVREEKIEGLNTYVFRQIIDKAQVAQREVPKAIFGDSSSGNVQASVMYGNVRTLWIEPHTGVLIKGQEQVDKSLVAEGYDDVPTTLGTIGYSDATVKKNVEDWSSKGALLGFIGGALTPVGIGLGILLIALGLVLTLGGGRRGRREA
ncbi:DUF3068 domain-containing protein [Phycicoccus sp. Root101]|uniref:DUF3068 domain-containing protein n=1 Tax=Phycicoccus sp. Root101 TaxID=1736421 RepID=UPI0009E68AC2|nr:DUF3068 domain-containing protein [Phycicoccus sp. Root101]